VGDPKSTWQKLTFEGVDAGTYNQGAGNFAKTPTKKVDVKDGRLTIRIHIKSDNTRAAIRELTMKQLEVFPPVDPPVSAFQDTFPFHKTKGRFRLLGKNRIHWVNFSENSSSTSRFETIRLISISGGITSLKSSGAGIKEWILPQLSPGIYSLRYQNGKEIYSQKIVLP